jgi:hypothetical protein
MLRVDYNKSLKRSFSIYPTQDLVQNATQSSKWKTPGGEYFDNEESVKEAIVKAVIILKDNQLLLKINQSSFNQAVLLTFPHLHGTIQTTN